MPFDYQLSQDATAPLYCIEMTEKAFRSAGIVLSQPICLGHMEKASEFPVPDVGPAAALAVSPSIAPLARSSSLSSFPVMSGRASGFGEAVTVVPATFAPGHPDFVWVVCGGQSCLMVRLAVGNQNLDSGRMLRKRPQPGGSVPGSVAIVATTPVDFLHLPVRKLSSDGPGRGCGDLAQAELIPPVGNPSIAMNISLLRQPVPAIQTPWLVLGIFGGPENPPVGHGDALGTGPWRDSCPKRS